ncbi:hypothetical protein BJ508DRAFT_377015 [Ascobolus immersus RN42]|uniref:Protein kinase domain-containing protein n=1 Tax=Ascobolus immersus RN42 TaxID=1160509 RepID=A0A3N4I3H3_ASCIM|nr:hypothetical protein BJ508DRAFT_377015 [Ascobolus immersus RN42]
MSAIVESCLKYGNNLVATYRTTERPAETVLGEEAVLHELEAVWEKTRAQLNIIASLWDNLHDDLKDKLGEGLADLKERLTFGYRVGNGSITDITAARAKDGISSQLWSLQQWHESFDHYFQLVARLTSSADTDGISSGNEKALFMDSERYTEVLSLTGLRAKGARRATLTKRSSMIKIAALFTKKPKEYVALLDGRPSLDGEEAFGKEVLLHVPAAGLETCPRNIYHSHYRIARLPTGGKGKAPIQGYGAITNESTDRPVVIENIVLGVDNENVSARAECYTLLSKKLRGLNPAMGGLLPCSSITQTVIPDTENAMSVLNGSEPMQSRRVALQMTFTIPETVTPTSATTTLRGLIEKQSSLAPSIHARIQLAFNMSKSLLSIHTLGIHHKNITPDTFLIFPTAQNNRSPTTYSEDLGTPFLQGYQLINMQFATPNNEYGSHMPWAAFIYMHPSRYRTWDSGFQSTSSQNARIKAFAQDVYSFGICLLEIGLWSTMAKWDAPDGQGGDWVPGMYLQRVLIAIDPQYAKLTSKELKDILLKGDINPRDILLKISELKLEGHMGHEYSRVVEDCLCVLETFGFNRRRRARGESVSTYVNDRSVTSAPAEADEKKADIGVWFLEKVYGKLRMLSII